MHVKTMAQSGKKTSNSVRIIAGQYRSRKLEFPSIEGLRPTADRIRETLFNWLQDRIRGEACLDLFAGSGALGFESLSRGASRVDFVERDTEAVKAIRANIEKLDAKNVSIYSADALEWLESPSRSSKQYGLIFLDPPFKGKMLGKVIEKIDSGKLLSDSGFVYIEKETQDISEELPSNWVEIRNKKAGSVQFGLYKILRSSE